MRPLKTAKAGTLQWVQPTSGARDYELRDGAQVFGRLQMATCFGTLASASCSEGSWTFKRVGCFKPSVTIRPSNLQENTAIFKPSSWGQGVLELPGAKLLRWKPTNSWMTDGAFFGADGTRIVWVRPDGGPGLKDLFKYQGRVDFEASATALAEFPLLVLLGWYLLLMQRLDDDATTVAVLAATV